MSNEYNLACTSRCSHPAFNARADRACALRRGVRVRDFAGERTSEAVDSRSALRCAGKWRFALLGSHVARRQGDVDGVVVLGTAVGRRRDQ